MSNRRSIEELKLEGAPKGNLKRSLGYGAEKSLAKLADLEAMFEDLKQRRDEALADIKERGQIVVVEKFSPRGALVQQRVPNPSLRIARETEKQMVQIAALIGTHKSKSTGALTVDDLFDFSVLHEN